MPRVRLTLRSRPLSRREPPVFRASSGRTRVKIVRRRHLPSPAPCRRDARRSVDPNAANCALDVPLALICGNSLVRTGSVVRMPTQGEHSFLEAAALVLGAVGVPLSPVQITDEAIKRGLIHSSGATPAQTMKSKLSTDILARRGSSQFMRTGRNQFGLRAWKGSYSEYVAERYQKALLNEEIVVFERELLRRFVPGPGIHQLTVAQSQELLASLFPMQRSLAEDDFSVVQLVSQFLVTIGDRYATYKRTRRLPESRLHGVYSVLFGGHLNTDDVPPLVSIFDPAVGPDFIQRELREELRFADPPQMHLLGVIYDDSRAVSRQHLGVLYRVIASPGQSLEVGERGFLQQLRFETAREIGARLGDFENWSELVFKALISPDAGAAAVR